ncbi:MAG: flagellar basal body protein FliL [Thermodesulfobacteria bacterium]|nr:flagellar basal body protein FliL [Thermodesulfobacteriota bacterium]
MAKEEKKEKAEAEAKEAKEKKGGSKLLIIIIALLVLIIIGGAGAFFLLFSAPSDEEIAKEIKQDESPQEIVAPTPESIGVVVDLKPFLVNLADPKARHFLKATLSLEVKDDEAKGLVEQFLPKIRNDILLLLSSKTLEDVITIEGKVRLKDEIMSRVSRIIGPGQLKDVYFSQFVVQ